MNKYLFLFLALFIANAAKGQKCDCVAKMHFLENKIERNLPAYHDQVVLAGRTADYKRHKDACNKIAATLNDTTRCVYLIAKYISFFRDEHLSVNYKDNYFPFAWQDAKDNSKKRRFFQKQKVYTASHVADKTIDAVEGYWQSKDKNYIVQVIKNNSSLWDYAAIIIKADSQYWSHGQLKFSLKKTDENHYESIYLFPNRRPQAYGASLNKDELSIGRVNIFYRIKDTTSYKPADNAINTAHLEFKELSPQTNYFMVPDFQYEHFPAIDSIVKANLPALLSKPNLIIDVRNNGGGGDRSYSALLSLIQPAKMYELPIMPVFYGTPDIIKHYEDNKYKYCETKEDSLDDDAMLALMKAHKNDYTPFALDTFTLDTVYKYPLKVGIIMNRYCASATEGFILNSRLSNKVKLYGENTWGMVSYGDWMSVDIPDLPVEVSIATKKMAMRDNADIEGRGITPNVLLDVANDKDWAKQVQADMEK